MMDFMDSDDARAVLREKFRQYLKSKPMDMCDKNREKIFSQIPVDNTGLL